MIDIFKKFTGAYLKGFSFGFNSDKEEISLIGEAVSKRCSETPEYPGCAGFIAGFKSGKKQLEQKIAKQSERGSAVNNFICQN